ncbi:MAG: alpha/beta hydrolase, partial [Planctomycetaceae bacterium]
QWFAGAVAFAATSLPPHAWPVCGEHSDGKRILLGCGERDCRIAPKEQLEAVRALHLAGFAVTPRTYAARHELTAAMLRDVDHWIMESLGAIA